MTIKEFKDELQKLADINELNLLGIDYGNKSDMERIKLVR